MAQDSIGLKQGTVALYPPTPRWKEEFETEKEGLKALLGEYIHEIEHIGSTSAKILAKPIIDILVSLRSWDDLSRCREKLETAGYQYSDADSNQLRAFFAKGSEEQRTHHIHLTEYGSLEWQKSFAFWDYMRSHPETLKEYEELKQSLATQHPEDRDQYSKGKADFIKNVIKTSNPNLYG